MDTTYDLTTSGLRRSLHSEVAEFFKQLDGEDYNEYENEIDEIQNLISMQKGEDLEKGFWVNGDLAFYVIKNDAFIKETLEKAGYEVLKSEVSFSLYAKNDEGKEVRISDHDRPAYEVNGDYVKHDDITILVEKGEINSSRLIQKGFKKINENKTLYLS
nr:hypothetical protein [Listeria seeligeri]